MTIKELQETVNAITARPDATADEKTTELLRLRGLAPEINLTSRYKWEMVILTAIRDLIPSMEEDDKDVDMIYADTMIIEALVMINRSYTIVPYAEEVARLVMTFSVNICAAANMVDDALRRITEAMQGTGHPRLMMTLISLRFLLAEECDIPVDRLTDAAKRLVTLGELTGDRSLTTNLQESIKAVLTEEEIEQIKSDPVESGYRVDLIEYTEAWEEIIDQVEEMTQKALEGVPRHMGFCHRYWHTKQEILRKEFGMKWLSPAIMNPDIIFD